MKKFKLAKGWTKKKVMAQVKEGNNNTKSNMIDLYGYERCMYKSASGNHCAIGCFLPPRSKAMKIFLDVEGLICNYPSLMKYLPFDNMKALIDFQSTHDYATDGVKGKTVYDRVAKFLKNRVK